MVENDPYVISISATTSESVNQYENSEVFERICDKCLALIYIWFGKKIKICILLVDKKIVSHFCQIGKKC